MNHSLLANIDTIIQEFLSIIAKDFKIDETQLKKKWKEFGDKNTENTETTNASDEIYTEEKLNLLKCEELKNICKKEKLILGGKKSELVARLLNHYKKQLLYQKKDDISFVKNSFGNLEHQKSRLIIDPNTKFIIGQQSDSGIIQPLKEEDINFCKENNLEWKNSSVLPCLNFESNLINTVESDIESDIEPDD